MELGLRGNPHRLASFGTPWDSVSNTPLESETCRDLRPQTREWTLFPGIVRVGIQRDVRTGVRADAGRSDANGAIHGAGRRGESGC